MCRSHAKSSTFNLFKTGKHIFLAKEPFVRAKRPFIVAKGPFVLAKEPFYGTFLFP